MIKNYLFHLALWSYGQSCWHDIIYHEYRYRKMYFAFFIIFFYSFRYALHSDEHFQKNKR